MNSVPQKFISTEKLRIWPYLEKGCRCNALKWGHTGAGWAWNLTNDVLMRRGKFGHRDTQGDRLGTTKAGSGCCFYKPRMLASGAERQDPMSLDPAGSMTPHTLTSDIRPPDPGEKAFLLPLTQLEEPSSWPAGQGCPHHMHQHGGWKQQTCSLRALQVRNLKVSLGHSRGLGKSAFLPEGSRGDFLPFPASWGCPASIAWGPLPPPAKPLTYPHGSDLLCLLLPLGRILELTLGAHRCPGSPLISESAVIKCHCLCHAR